MPFLTQIIKLPPRQRSHPPPQQKRHVMQNTVPAQLLTGAVAQASPQGTSSSDSWTAGMVTCVLPYRPSHVDSMGSVGVQHPQNNIVSSRLKGHKTGLSEYTTFLHLAGFCLQALIQVHMASKWPHSRFVTKPTVPLVFFHQRNITWLEEASGPQECDLLSKTSWKSGSRFHKRIRQTDRWAPEAFSNAPILVNCIH